MSTSGSITGLGDHGHGYPMSRGADTSPEVKGGATRQLPIPFPHDQPIWLGANTARSLRPTAFDLRGEGPPCLIPTSCTTKAWPGKT